MGKKIWKAMKVTLLSLLGLVVVLIGSGLAYRAYRHHQIAKATVIDTTNGIDEALFVKIGGIDQWISMRGQNRNNPVLLIVHGGPGLVMSPYPRNFLFGWTRDFTVVLWDQRGAGKTFGKSGPLDSAVTIDRMAQDGEEVAEFLRGKLHKEKIVLVGLSWGTILGVRMAKERPDLFYAYVGTGQGVNQRKYRAIGYEQLLAEARARQDRKAVRELESIGAPPWDSFSKESTYSKWADGYEPGGLSGLSLASVILFDSGASFRDLRDYVNGLTTSDDHFRAAVEAEDLPALGTDFAIPFFVFQGALDNITPAQPVKAYVDSITAPQKRLVLIPDAGHSVISTRSDEFLRLLDRLVRPLAIEPEPAIPAAKPQ
jgi:pimeloyl-ACP methyl ester carboxylesterase